MPRRAYGPGVKVCWATALSGEPGDREESRARSSTLRPERGRPTPNGEQGGQNEGKRGPTGHDGAYLSRELHAARFGGRSSPRGSTPAHKHRPTGRGPSPRPHPPGRRPPYQSPARPLMMRSFSALPLVPQQRGRDWLESATSPRARRVAWTGFPPSSGRPACGDSESQFCALGRVGAVR